jgi:Domain of unknown function (DUF6438)
MSTLVTHGRELRPNTSVQRTRSSASPLRSPLRPLGRSLKRAVCPIVLLLSIISGSSTVEAAEPAVPLPSDMVVALIRGRCYGTCPRYEVTVFESGRVEFIPGSAVTLRDRKSWNIPRTAVAQIRGLLDELEVLKLKDEYGGAEESACVELSSDNPSVYLTIHHKGTWKFIRHDLGCRGSVDVSRLETLEKSIDRIPGAERAIR